MNSFAADLKNELASLPINKTCCARAEMAGFFRAAGVLVRAGGANIGLAGFTLSTSNSAVFRRLKNLMLKINKVEMVAQLAEGATPIIPKRYMFSAPPSARATEFLSNISSLEMREGKAYIMRRVPQNLLLSKCCRRAFLRGLFLGAGTISAPEKSRHFEICITDPLLAIDTRRTMRTFTDIHPKLSRRRGKFVVYLKKSEQIKDMLGIMGADSALLIYENIRMLGEIKGAANRASNCDGANIDRIIKTGAAQAKLAKKFLVLAETGAKLPAKLVEAAQIRIKNPEASLSEIAALFSPPISKSAAAARFARMERFIVK